MGIDVVRFLLLALALLSLPACDKLVGSQNLAGATTFVSDTDLARERILITLRDIRPANRNFSPTLAIIIEPDGTVVTRRMRFFFEPDPNMPMATLEEPIDLFGPGSFDVVERTHRASLTPAQANIIRRKLSVLRPETLSRDYANISPATMPSCSRSTSHDPLIIGVTFLAPGGESGAFGVMGSCSPSDEATVREIVEDVRRNLPPSPAARGFSY